MKISSRSSSVVVVAVPLVSSSPSSDTVRCSCFDEARDGTLDVRVRGNTLFPAHICGRLHILMAALASVLKG
jgi:hypothetical protein